MDLLCNRKDGVAFIALVGQFWQREDLQAFECAVKESISGGCLIAVIDVDHLSFINSMGLGMLARSFLRFRDSGGKMILYRPRSCVLEVIEISGFKTFMPIASDEKELEGLIQGSDRIL